MAEVLAQGAAPVVVETAPPGTAVVSAEGAKVTKVTAEEQPKVETPSPKGDRPAWLPEKFATAEDFAKSYGELEAKLGAPKTETVVPPVTPVVDPAVTAVAAAGIDMDALGKEYAENNGALTPATLEALKGKGLAPETVAAYIDGQKARADAYTTKLAATVGGNEQMTKMFEWAGMNMSEAEVAAFNGTMTSFNEPLATLALAGLAARYTTAMGKSPELVTGSGAPGSGAVKGFASTQEIEAAMKDKRYKSGDKAYHAEVAKRMAATQMFSRG